MLSDLTLHNFKAFDDLAVEFRPITLFLGPNNSGKSSIIAALRLLAQTVGSNDPQVPLLLNGAFGDFGTYKDIVYNNFRGRPFEIGIAVQRNSSDRKEDSNRWPSVRAKKTELSVGYKYRSVRREIVLKNVQIKVDGESLLTTSYSEDSERQLIQKIGRLAVPSQIKAAVANVLRMHNFIPNPFISYTALKKNEDSLFQQFMTKEVEIQLVDAGRAGRDIQRFLRNIEYIGAMRVPPSRTYLFTGERRDHIGASGEYAANVIVMDSARSGSRSRKVLENVREWFVKAGIASDLRIQQLSDRHYEIRMKHPVTKEEQDLADVGYGNSQVLPVLVGGYNLTVEDTFVVEEPEIHLHPRAQSELGDFFLQLYQRGVQSIIETHSEYLILRLQQHVASGQIAPEHIRIYYVHAQDGRKQVKRLRLDEQGQFIEKWPEGFFPERLEEAKKLARIRYARNSSEHDSNENRD